VPPVPLVHPPFLRRFEYGALLLALIGAAWWQRDALGPWFWLWLVGPDIFGFIPASLMGSAPARGVLPPRGVWLYNTTHTLVLPLVLWAVVLAVTGYHSWPTIGWLLHIAADRTAGYGLRDPAGVRTDP
jgi:hypothetical protein